MDTSQWARTLDVSQEAVELYRRSDVIDLHIDSFIWHRLFGYDVRQRNSRGWLGRRFYGHADLPRAIDGGLTGATWVITTNPFRTRRGRLRAFQQNLQRLRSALDETPGVRHVRDTTEYQAARAAGEHGAFIGIQGGNALDDGLEALELLQDGAVLRVTLVHFTGARAATSSAPWKSRMAPLTDFGRDYVRRLNELRIGVDLAHINRRGFFDVVEVHDPSLPLFVTHTGVSGVYEHWRNVDDEQLKAIADTGGTIGVIAQTFFLGRRNVNAATVVDHIQHIVDTVGEDHASIGTDWDGAIIPPADLVEPYMLPRLVQEMLDRRWSDVRIAKILGGNVLRVVELLRG